MTAPTDRQRDVLDFILSHIAEHQRPPTWREIGDHMGITKNGVGDHLKALRRKGYIEMDGPRARAVRVLLTAQGWPVTYGSRGLWFEPPGAA